jgi:hypothetical protein
MPLSTLEDVNGYLPQDKISADQPTLDKVSNGVERTIKGYLSGIFVPTVLASWTDETDTPEVIQDIFAKLAACYIYRTAYAEDIPDENNYAMKLYTEALGTLEGIRIGTVVLPDITTDEMNVYTEFTPLDFLPNDSTTPGAQFTMSMEF